MHFRDLGCTQIKQTSRTRKIMVEGGDYTINIKQTYLQSGNQLVYISILRKGKMSMFSLPTVFSCTYFSGKVIAK